MIAKKYVIKSEGVDFPIEITGTEDDNITEYNVTFRHIDDGTRAIIEQVKKEIKHKKIFDVKKISLDDETKLKDFIRKESNNILTESFNGLSAIDKEYFLALIIREMIGLSDIGVLLADDDLEEIVILSADEPVRVIHRKFSSYGWLTTNIKPKSEEQILDFANIIARRVGKTINSLNPVLDAHLSNGDRANTVLNPVCKKGHGLVIRKFCSDPWTIVDFIKNGTCTAKVFALLWFTIQYEGSILISGGTASGKTSFLACILPFIPPAQRVITIEETSELKLPSFIFWEPLLTRSANSEGEGLISMHDLVVACLRRRPDRIVMGEVRRQKEAETLFEGLHTGHSVYATVHADSVDDTIRRLTNPPISVPEMLLSGVDLNVVMFRDRRRGFRRVSEIGEFVQGQDNVIRPNVLFEWQARKDQLVESGKSKCLFNNLSKNTGLTIGEIDADLKVKERILEWLVANNKRSIEDIGKVMNLYYSCPKALLAKVTGGVIC